MGGFFRYAVRTCGFVRSFNMQRFATPVVKYLIGFAAVLVIRLLPFRPPNVEPLMAAMLPFAKRYGALGGFLFAAGSIVLFDAVTSGWGTWTLVTALAYGLLGIAARWFFAHRDGTARNYLLFAAVGTLLYDAATGLTVGPLFWGQPFMAALMGQVPFTVMHLIGNIAFAALLSPFIERWIVAQVRARPVASSLVAARS